MGWVGRVFAQPATTHTRSGGWFFNLQLTCNSNRFVGSGCWRVVVDFGWTRLSPKCFEMRQDLAKSGEIPSDLVRFLANRDEKSLVWPDPVFSVTKIDRFKWKSGQNLKKWSESGKMAGFWMDFGLGWVSWVLKLKTDNRPAGVGLLRSKPASDR